MQAELYHDLADTGLLAFAETWGVMNDVNTVLKGREGVKYSGRHVNGMDAGLGGDAAAMIMPMAAAGALAGDQGPACSMQHSGAGCAHTQPMSVDQAPQDVTMQQALQRQGSCSVSTVDEQTAHTNRAAVAAAAEAAQAVSHARHVIQDVTSLHKHRLRSGPVGSSTQATRTSSLADAGAARRKSSRSCATDASASRSAAQAQAQSVAANSKGLRHFAVLVCEQVRERGRTTYNEVADLLVAKLTADSENDGKDAPDDKTIRRRVYDALNVLMAVDIIQREKKDIIWRGLPGDLSTRGTGAAGPMSAEDQLRGLRQERMRCISEVDRKQNFLQELVQQHEALKVLISRNAAQRGRGQTGTEIHLPFILIQTRSDATVEVKISDDLQDVRFDIYNSPFQLHDDSGVIKQMASFGLPGASSILTPVPVPAPAPAPVMPVSAAVPALQTPCTVTVASRMAMTGVMPSLPAPIVA